MTQPLNDTGIDWYANGSTNDFEAAPAGYEGQDADYGRDARSAAGTLSKVGGGVAGFDFTKLDAAGNDLAASATSWSCVRDNVTGLVWEVKTNDGGLRDKDNTYTWYNPDSATNGGSAGTQDGGTCTGGASCDTAGYVAAVNAAELCGATDWRVPTVAELQSIVDYGTSNPAIDVSYFPNTRSSRLWSSSPWVGSRDIACHVNFNVGSASRRFKHYSYEVRLMRGGQ